MTAKKRVDRGIYRLSDGLFEIAVSTGKQPDGRYGQVFRRHRGTLTSARAARRTLIGEVEAGEHRRASKTVNELFDAWLADKERLGRAPKTLRGYRDDADTYWRPALGARMLHKVTRRDVRDVLDALTDRGVAASTVHHVHACLSSAWSWAVAEEWVADDPTKNVPLPSKINRRPMVPTPHVVRAALAAAGETPLQRFMFLGAVTGCRSSELRAIRIRSIDLERGVAGIEAAMSDEQDWTTKNRQERPVGLDAVTVDVVRRQVEHMEKQAADHGVDLVPEARLFSDDPHGRTHWREDAVTKQVSTLFDHLEQPPGEPCSHKLGEQCPRPGPHAAFTFKHLRKFMDTYGQELGFADTAVASRAGHDPTVARRHYTGVIESTDRALSAALAGLLAEDAVTPSS